jgi:uncharacterized protein YkwD
VRRALATTAAVAAILFAAALPTPTIGAGNSRQTASGAAWLGPSGLESDNGRLKRSAAVQPLPTPNAWRTQVIRPTAQQTSAPAQAPNPSANDGGDYDAAVVAQTNTIRKSHDLAPLKISPRLEAAAQLHSRNMGRLGFFTHESADGSAFWKRVQQFYPQGDATYWAVGENLIWSSPDLSVDSAMRGWMESPGHRDNILGKDWREIGCFSVHLDSAPGVYSGRKVVIITCDFGVRR